MQPLLELARSLAREFATRADEADRVGRMPREDVAALRASGYLAASLPREFGGHAATLHASVEAQLELAQGSASTAMLAAMQLHLFGHASETRPWPEALFAEFCARAVRGEIFNSAASEPLLGSPSRGGLPETYAEPRPDGGWTLNGHKTWTTGGRYLDHMLVRCRLEAEPAVLWVRQEAEGVEWAETWQHALSLRASESHDVYFRAVQLPPEALLVRGKDTSKNAWFPMLATATYLGAAYAARNALIAYARERVPTALGKPIASVPAIQRQIGEMEVALQAARALLLEAASSWDTTDDRARAYPRIVAAKHFAIEVANTVTDKALRVAGGASITPALSLERHFRDVRAGPMHPPSGDTALELVGQAAIENMKADSLRTHL